MVLTLFYFFLLMKGPYNRRPKAVQPAGARSEMSYSNGENVGMGWKVAVAILATSTVFLFLGIFGMLIALLVGHASYPSIEVSESCDDGNACTIGYLVNEERCEYYPVPNGLPCSSDCHENGTCWNGECSGDCIGLCETPFDCPRLIGVDVTDLHAWDAASSLSTTRQCFFKNCYYTLFLTATNSTDLSQLGLDPKIVRNFLGYGNVFDYNQTGVSTLFRVDRQNLFVPWQDMFADICLSFIHEDSRSCLQASLDLVMYDFIGDDLSMQCSYWYSCHESKSFPGELEYAMLFE